MADEAISYPVFPRNMHESMVVNGLSPQAAHGYVIEAGIRCLAAWGHQYPGFAAGLQEIEVTIAPGEEYVTLIRLRPYVRDLEVWWLASAEDGDSLDYWFQYDSLDVSSTQHMIGRSVTGTYDFSQDTLTWVHTVIRGIGDGSNSGKADAGTNEPRKFAVVNDANSDGDLHLYNVKLRARHTVFMNLQ